MLLAPLSLAGLLLPGVFSEYAPHFHRILGAAAPVALLCGVGLDGVWRAWHSASRTGLRWLGPSVAALLLIFGAATSAREYFVRWANLPDLFYAFDAGLWDVGRWVARQPNNTIYISPQGDNHSTLAFAWRKMTAKPVRYDGRFVLPLTDGTNTHPEQYLVIEHEDFRTPLLLPEVFPTLSVDYAVRDGAGQLYAQVYTRPAATPPLRTPHIQLEQVLGDGITLLGYDQLPEMARAGESLYLQYHWLISASPATEWTIFNHVVDGAGEIVAGFDSPPGRGTLTTTHWQAGWRLLDEYEIKLPTTLPPGDYMLRMGLYDSAGNLLPATGTAIELGTITLVK
jgi:hypothetical protein